MGPIFQTAVGRLTGTRRRMVGGGTVTPARRSASANLFSRPSIYVEQLVVSCGPRRKKSSRSKSVIAGSRDRFSQQPPPLRYVLENSAVFSRVSHTNTAATTARSSGILIWRHRPAKGMGGNPSTPHTAPIPTAEALTSGRI